MQCMYPVYIFSIYPVYIQYIFSIYPVYIQYIFRIYIEDISSIYPVCIIYVVYIIQLVYPDILVSEPIKPKLKTVISNIQGLDCSTFNTTVTSAQN